jgi:DNA (cytosine-5)-methyltransferase 1
MMAVDGADSRPLLVDLFCGAGGLSLGLQQAGYRPVFAVDFDRHAISTYKRNHPHVTAVEKDIADVTAAEIRAAAGGRTIDLIAGGPSCQGFSTHGKRVEDDPRNFLFHHFVRLVREVRPKFFLMENVKGLLTFRGGYFRELIMREFAAAGYKVDSRVVSAADYGVPQLRHRIVFIGTRTKAAISFPEPTHGENGFFLKPYVSINDALSDLPLLGQDLSTTERHYDSAPANAFQRYVREGKRKNTVSLHYTKPLSALSSQIIRHVQEGAGLRSIEPHLLPARFQKMRKIKNGALRRDCTTLYFRPLRSKPSYTITCNFRNVASGPFVHPVENRGLTYREAARLMSFPDSYVFEGAMLPRQIGNAVPPLMGKALGDHLLKLLREDDVMVPSEKKHSWSGNVSLDSTRTSIARNQRVESMA